MEPIKITTSLREVNLNKAKLRSHLLTSRPEVMELISLSTGHAIVHYLLGLFYQIYIQKILRQLEALK